MSRRKTIQPSAAEVAFNLFARLTDEERSEFSKSVYGRALFHALQPIFFSRVGEDAPDGQ